MTADTMFLICGLFAVVMGLAHFIAIVSFLQDRGVKINWFLIKLYMPKYVAQYRRIAIRETGRAGRHFSGFVISMNAALVLVLTGAILK